MAAVFHGLPVAELTSPPPFRFIEGCGGLAVCDRKLILEGNLGLELGTIDPQRQLISSEILFSAIHSLVARSCLP